WRRRTSEAVLTRVWKADASSGFGLFLSRPMVHGPTSAGSDSPSLVMATAHPSSSSFLMTRAVHPLLHHNRGSLTTAGRSASTASFVAFDVMPELYFPPPG